MPVEVFNMCDSSVSGIAIKKNWQVYTACRFASTSMFWAAVLALVLLGFAKASFGQVDTGAIVGSVEDSTGAAVPGVTVTATHEGTGIKHSASTDSSGEYTLSPLPLGFYTLTFERQGFKTSIQRHVEVTIQAQLKVNVALNWAL